MFFCTQRNQTGNWGVSCLQFSQNLGIKRIYLRRCHHLFHYEGKCKSLHGHTYHLQIAVSGFLDERGMTYDFGDIKAIYKDYLEPHLDHRYLNETLPYMNTTAENMVYWIFQTMSQELPDERGLRMEYVRLYETPTVLCGV